MLRNTHLTLALLGGCFLFSLDQILKYTAHHGVSHPIYLAKPWIGWEYFANPGIAFSLPFPNTFIIVITPFILLFLGILLWKQSLESASPRVITALLFIMLGALSNFIDRFLFAVTIDYIRLFTSVVNVADMMIVVGALLLIIPKKSLPVRPTTN